MMGGRASGRKRAKQGGLSLIEMMISLAILSITMSSFLSATNAVSRLFHHQRMLTQAIAAGESLTEGLLLLDPSDSELETGTYERYYTAQGIETLAPSAIYTAEWSVAPYTAVPGMRELIIRVYWNERGDTKFISWVTYRN